MIGKLRGRIDEVDEDSVIIDVGGVGYIVFCSSRTLASLPPVGESTQLIIETHVREDHIHFYGFPDTTERDWFRLLCTVQGIGNKIALVILGAFPPQKLVNAILAKDASAFRAISGVGPKLAERIVTELKDKVLKMPVGSESWTVNREEDASTGKKARTTNHYPQSTEDTISALVNLGYSRSEAYTAAMKASQNAKSSGLDELIKLSLKELMRAMPTVKAVDRK